MGKQHTFTDSDYWKAIVLYGLNNATYKIALGKTLLNLSRKEKTAVSWQELSREFLNQYRNRLKADKRLPQQANPSRLTKVERIVRQLNSGNLSYDQAVDKVGREGFNDVIPRFQKIGTDSDIVSNHFYSYDFGKSLTIHDSLLKVCETDIANLQDELEARWSLLEGAFLMNHEHWDLANDLRNIYLNKGHERKSLTGNIPFLQAYQGNCCFYCAEPIKKDDVHVDHVLPRQVLHHDQEWNLVLAHSLCNMQKGDQLVGEHYIRKLIKRNENLIGSNHPWKNRIKQDLGTTKRRRSSALCNHYENVKTVLGANYWNGTSNYNPASDPFHRRLITVLNNE